MQVHYGFELPKPTLRRVVTLGSYDGVHRGHREILAHLCEIAHRKGGESLVVTFHPHPRIVLGKTDGMQLLNTLEEKLSLLAQTGIDHVIVAPFTNAFSQLSAEEFVRQYLVEQLHIDTLMVGYDHHFGHAQQGDPQLLEQLSRSFQFSLEEIPQQSLHGEKISSTRVRKLIREGEMAEAAHYLNAPYPLSARLCKEGTLCEVDPWKLLPPQGIYPVQIHLNDKAYLDAKPYSGSDNLSVNKLRIGPLRNMELLNPLPSYTTAAHCIQLFFA